MIPIEGVLDKYDVEYDADRTGNQQVRCPFHDDTHASASVHLDKGVFICFGCGVSGDAIALLMTQEGLEFSAAERVAQELAGEAGAQVSRRSNTRGSFLPGRSGSRPGRRGWKSPWTRRQP